MKILFVNQCYWPDHAATAQILVDLAEELVYRGHDVHVVCSRRAYSDSKAAYPRKECHHGVTIHRVGGLGWGKRAGMGSRMGGSLWCLAGALVRCILLSKPDVVVTLTSPPLIGVVGQVLQRLKGVKHVHWCMDLFPDVAVTFEVIRRNGLVHKASARLTCGYLRSADAVMALSRQMAKKIRAYGVRPKKTYVVPVWADSRKLQAVTPEHNGFLAHHGLKDKFVLMYSGNLAHGGDIDTMIETLRQLRHDRDIVFVLISEGKRLDEFRAKCTAYGLDNVLFLPYQRREELSQSLSAADLHLVTNKRGIEGLREPCKVYGILAVGRPFILIGGECVATDFARERGMGRVVDEGDVCGLVAAIRELKQSEAQRAQMCRRAAEVFKEECDCLKIVESFENIVFAVVRKEMRETARLVGDRVEVDRVRHRETIVAIKRRQRHASQSAAGSGRQS